VLSKWSCGGLKLYQRCKCLITSIGLTFLAHSEHWGGTFGVDGSWWNWSAQSRHFAYRSRIVFPMCVTLSTMNCICHLNIQAPKVLRSFCSSLSSDLVCMNICHLAAHLPFITYERVEQQGSWLIPLWSSTGHLPPRTFPPSLSLLLTSCLLRQGLLSCPLAASFLTSSPAGLWCRVSLKVINTYYYSMYLWNSCFIVVSVYLPNTGFCCTT